MMIACRCARRNPADDTRPFPYPWLLSVDRRYSLGRNDTRFNHRRMRKSSNSERQGRVIDHDESGSMEKKKREGYF